jgi:hypothetical protein
MIKKASCDAKQHLSSKRKIKLSKGKVYGFPQSSET